MDFAKIEKEREQKKQKIKRGQVFLLISIYVPEQYIYRFGTSVKAEHLRRAISC